MSELKSSVAKEQQKTKPSIETTLNECLSGDNLKNAMNFAMWLKQNKLNPRWASRNTYNIKYKGKNLINIRINGNIGLKTLYRLEEGSWFIGHNYKGEHFQEDINGSAEHLSMYDQIKEAVFKNIQYCEQCCGCSPGWSANIFGKQTDHICRLTITNPSAEELEYAKIIIEATKNRILSSTP